MHPSSTLPAAAAAAAAAADAEAVVAETVASEQEAASSALMTAADAAGHAAEPPFGSSSSSAAAAAEAEAEAAEAEAASIPLAAPFPSSSSSSPQEAAASSGSRRTNHDRQEQHPQSSTWQLVEQRLRSSWGRPTHPVPTSSASAAAAAEPSSLLMHQLIAKIGSGASAGIVLPLPTMAPSTTATSTSSVAETGAAASASVSSLSLLSAEWRAVEERCQTHAHEAAHLDRRGRTCLHAACAKKPPVSTIEALLYALSTGNSNSSSNNESNSSHSGAATSILLQRDKHGRTPLLIAIASRADLHVIHFLLHKAQRAAAVTDHLGNVPLMLACEATTTTSGGGGGSSFPSVNNNHHHHDTSDSLVVVVVSDQVQLVRLLLLAFPQGARHESLNGRMALHVAVECNAPPAVIAHLVQVYPHAVICDGCGVNPLFLAIRYNVHVQTIQTLVAACPEATLTRDRGRGMPLRRAIENQSPLAVQACLCTCPLVVLDAESSSPVHNTALHAALKCGGGGGSGSSATTVKVATVELMLRMAPQLATTVNRAGQTPLLLACQRWQRFRDSLRRQQLQYQQRQLLLTATTTTTTTAAAVRPPTVAAERNNNQNSTTNTTLAAIHTLEAHCRQMWLIIIPLIKAAFYGVIDDPIVGNTSTSLTTLTTTNAALLQKQIQQDHHGDDNDNSNHDLATWQSSLHQHPLHVLHAAVSLQQLPLDIVIHALELYADDATTRNDPSGRYPLQLCILTSQPSQQHPASLQQHATLHEEASIHPAMAGAAAIQRFNNDQNLFLLREQVILKTLQVFPQATQLPDANGRLALSLAAQQARSISTTVLQELWSHHPAALVTLDPVWRLYPFQMAAAASAVPQEQQQQQPRRQQGNSATTAATMSSQNSHRGTADWRDIQDFLQLSAIFVLLKQCPDAIHMHLCKS